MGAASKGMMHMGTDYDKESLHKTYLKGRRMRPEVLEVWLEAIGEFLPEPAPGRRPRILDLGCGVGRCCIPLAERFGAEAVLAGAPR